jgi:protein-disulfide isomerase
MYSMRQSFRSVSLFCVCLGITLLGASVRESVAEGITEEQATAMLNELKEIRLLLERQQQNRGTSASGSVPAAAEKVSLTMKGGYALGSESAPLTLVEFTDYQCPFCNKFHLSTFPELKKNFVDTGLVRFVSRDLPLQFHKNAFEAARSARCAGEEGRYWEVRDWLSSNPDNLSHEAILNFAQQTGVDPNVFQACLDSERHRDDIHKDVAEAQAIGITGTPGFVIGRTTNGVLEGVKIVGAQPYGTFESRIKQLLATGEKP